MMHQQESLVPKYEATYWTAWTQSSIWGWKHSYSHYMCLTCWHVMPHHAHEHFSTKIPATAEEENIFHHGAASKTGQKIFPWEHYRSSRRRRHSGNESGRHALPCLFLRLERLSTAREVQWARDTQATGICCSHRCIHACQGYSWLISCHSCCYYLIAKQGWEQ